MTAHALWIAAKGRAEIRREALPAPREDEVVIRTLYSGLSRGTERLVFHGEVPESEHDRMRCPMMAGQYSFPVKYGYAAVGLVEDGPGTLIGKTVFALAPHQDRIVAPLSLLGIVPDAIPAHRAVLTANMETALNAVWDSGVTAGDRVAVVGAGIVGLLIARIVARMPGTDVVVLDPEASRRPVAQALGVQFHAPGDPAPVEADVVFHASASVSGLENALAAAAFEATIVEVSWYGDRPVTALLGGAFHSRRLRLVSSQVGHVAARQRARWDYARRRDMALALLADAALETLFTETIAFTDLPAAMPRLLSPGAPGLQTLIRYS